MRPSTTEPFDLASRQKPTSAEVGWEREVGDECEGIYHITSHSYHQNYFQESVLEIESSYWGERCNSPLKTPLVLMK